MSIFIVRVWLPDRPGALGAVASRIGAVHADVIGIDIIDRGAGRAVDELVIDLPDPGLVDLLIAEIGEVDGVDVENIRAVEGTPADPAVSALAVAGRLRACGVEAAHPILVEGARELVAAQWAAVIDLPREQLLASVGEGVPTASWLVAFARGATAGGASVDLEELALAPLRGGDEVLVVARPHLPLRGREQRVLDALAELL